jgi:ribosomal protein S18 acetylase RimI-like enzyme
MRLVRPVSPSDIDLVCHHREEMFREAASAEANLKAMADPFRTWLAARLTDGKYFGFVAEDDSQPIGAIGLMVLDWPPHPLHPNEDRHGYVLNLYVEPSYRGRGVARDLMRFSDSELTKRGLTYAVLHATQAGRRIYEQIGWASTTEMGEAL